MDLYTKDVLFRTDRTEVIKWSLIEAGNNDQELVRIFKRIMTKDVTRSLPDGWQGLIEPQEIMAWYEDRKKDRFFFSIQMKASSKVVGFLFLYEDEQDGDMADLRLGYLLAQDVWGKGIGSELMAGLSDLCIASGKVRSISGGVERKNIGSIKVLERNGFLKVSSDLPEGTLLYRRSFL